MSRRPGKIGVDRRRRRAEALSVDAVRAAAGAEALDGSARGPGSRIGAVFAGVHDLILTPHAAGASRESDVRIPAVTARAVRRHLEA